MTMMPTSVAGAVSDVVPNLSIPPVDYTSRDYASIVNDLINLIPTYIPEWTDRSPGDFGVVLIELFAYMGDILNFYSDRIANEAFLATAQQRQSVLNIAALLDYTPSNNVAALTQLTFSVPSVSPTPAVKIPAGTQVSTALTPQGAITFATTQDAWIWGDVALVTSEQTGYGTGKDMQQVVLNQGPYTYPNQTVKVAGTTWALANNNSFAGYAATAKVYTVIVPTTTSPPIIQFGAGGHSVGGVPVGGAIPQTTDLIDITYAPVSGNSYSVTRVPAQNGVPVNNEVIGISTGTPNMTFTLFQTPVVDASVNIFVDEGAGPQPWTYFQRIVDALYTDPAFTLNTDANGVVTVSFGDGVNGAIPIPGASITASYMVGGGAVGNVSANSLVNLITPIPNAPTTVAVTNPAAASGGADAESLDHIRIHAPLSLTAINRAVTLDDYAALVLNVTSVAKAAATSSAANAVNLYIHPAGDFIVSPTTNPPSPPGYNLSAAVNAIWPSITNSNMTGYLDDKKMATVSINVLPPQYNRNGALQTGYVPVDISANIQVLPQYKQTTVTNNVIAAIYNLLLFNVVDFGYRVTLSSVFHAIQAVEGVDYCNVTVLCRDEQTPQTCADVVCAVYEIPQVNAVKITPTGGF